MDLRRRIVLTIAAALAAVGTLPAQTPADRATFEAARTLGRGVNLGNMFEAPKEGEWGLNFQDDFPAKIKAAGFDHIRLPVKWSSRAAKDAPYAIDPAFFARIDHVLDQAEKAGLRVVLNDHHHDPVYKDPASATPRFLAIWKQVATRYQDRPDTLVFEALNEPHDQLSPQAWNDLFPKALAVIRETNPTRPVIVGPGSWNSYHELKSLVLPEADRRLIVTIHWYNPFEFTHQGASWAQGSEKWLGRKWIGSPQDKKGVTEGLEIAAKYGKDHIRPLYLGEFGAYEKADMDSRVAWTKFVREEAERLGMAWAYWEFAAGFGIYDPRANRWREPLLKALVP